MTCNHCVDLEIPEGATCSFCLGGDGCTGACDHCPTEHATRIYAYADDVVACVLEHAAANPNQWRSGPQGPKTRLDVLQLAPRRVLAAWLEWQGILGYADRALTIMDAESEVLEPDQRPATDGTSASPRSGLVGPTWWLPVKPDDADDDGVSEEDQQRQLYVPVAKAKDWIIEGDGRVYYGFAKPVGGIFHHRGRRIKAP